MHDYCAGQNKADRRRSLGVWRCLLILDWYTNVIPKMYFAFFHVDEITKPREIVVEMIAGEGVGIAAVNIENKLEAVGRTCGDGIHRHVRLVTNCCAV